MNEIKGICCEVKNCVHHNNDNSCSAGHITVGSSIAKTTTDKISSVNKKRLVTEPLFYLINIVLAAGIRLQSDTKKAKYHFAHVFF